jgi:signal transduction histidine kinase/purine-cytosine permease-like protein/FixJ family two-component response regulator
MSARQQIFRVRRRYNQWVNNQTLEDYALRFTAKGSRRWSIARVANTATGAISFLALEAIGAAITISYGFDNALAAVLVVSLLIFLAGLPICYYAARYGVDIDLLTRGAGFGYLGSTVTSLIYASFTFIFFALEAVIMAKALELVLGLPLALGYIISSVVVIPMVFFGITFISRFQLWTQPLWVFLQLLPLVFILFNDAGLLSEWQLYQGTKQEGPGANLLLFGAAASVMFALVAQIGEQVDFLRFLPEKTVANRASWWAGLLLAGPGWIIIGGAKILIGSFLAVVAIGQGLPSDEAADPTMMYTVAFGFVTDNAHLALVVAGIFVVVSQLKINVTNAYAGSIAWSNFFSRLTHNHPGRVVWLVFNVAIALLLMELGIYQAFESMLSIYAVVAVSWVGALVADLVINKPLGLSPKHIEFKRAHLYNINPVGVGAMVSASILGLASYLGLFGEYGQALAHFIALGSAFVIAPAIAFATKGKYYLAREPVIFSDQQQTLDCCVCQNNYESEDIAMCPAYDGPICSLCCSLDARCQDLCKEDQEVSQRVLDGLKRLFPNLPVEYFNQRLMRFVGLFLLITSGTGVLLALVYTSIKTEDLAVDALLEGTLWNVFFILVIIEGVISWLFVLTHESQIVAQEESQSQTLRLESEIDAHKKTDSQLQVAKELAEAANNAKSRYLTGISHELRSPLNTVLGYAQLMEMDHSTPETIRDQASVIKRSGEHLADLIEGLLDISKIEAGRLDIQRNHIPINALMNQLVNMFRLQAKEKGLEFTYTCHSRMPEVVMGDEKRLRQILINLLSNAIKFTESGTVDLSVSYRNHVAVFKVADTGIGIPENELERIFKPFERVRRPGAPAVPGTGLGLAITRLLADIMGGDIVVENNPDGGTTFTVWLMLSHVANPIEDEPRSKQIYGYIGPKKSILVVDDDPSHRGLAGDLLSPLGFNVVEARDAEDCLEMVSTFAPDLFLIDRLMPGIDGPTLAKRLREQGFIVPILMVTANASEDTLSHEENPAYNDYLIKPVRLESLLERLAFHMNITWNHTPSEDKTGFSSVTEITEEELPPQDVCQNIINYAEIGYLSKLTEIAGELKTSGEASKNFIDQFERDIKAVKFNQIIDLLKVKAEEKKHVL